MRKPLRIGIGGPVGSGKTALVDALCKTMRDRYRLGVRVRQHRATAPALEREVEAAVAAYVS